MNYNDSNYLKKGDSCYRKGRFYEAIECYNMGLQEDPYSTVLLVKKGNALCRLGYISEANSCFYRATNQARVFDILVQYVYDNYKNIGKNLKNIQKMLKSKYKIPIYQKQLKLFLISIKNQIKDQKEKEEFEEFKKEIPYKNRILLADYIEGFLKHYGNDYKNYIPRLHRFLWERNYDLTYSELEIFIGKQKNKMSKPGWGQQKSIDLMTGKEFEEFLVQLFKTCGYNVTKTEPGYDYGADMVLERYGERTVVQAKRQKRSVGLKAVQEVTAARKYYRAHKTLVVINGTFTRNAKELAKSNNVELWDRKRLMQEIKKMHLF